MGEDHNQSLDGRVERLEKAVEELQLSLDRILAIPPSRRTVTPDQLSEARPASAPRESQSQQPPPPPPPLAEPVTPSPEKSAAALPNAPPFGTQPISPKPAFTIPEHMRKFEYWLNKVGIGLMLFAVVFLFKYSIDQGWLTPPVRVAFGLALGIALIVMGLRVFDKKKHFALVLLGGGIATFYITGFAAFQILELVSHPTALAFMVGVTILSFFLSLKQDDAILSVLGALGGLGTPFLLYTGEGNLPGLVTYTCLILAGTVGIYFFKGWRVILWLSVAGGWIIFLIGLDFGLPTGNDIRIEHWALQWGVAFAWLAFWAVPVAREVVTAINPVRWPKTFLGLGETSAVTGTPSALDRHVHMFSISTPLIVLAISLSIWPHANEILWGWITIGAAVVYGTVSYGLKRWESLRNLAYTQSAMAVVLFTIALCLFFEEETLQLALTAEAVLLHLIARRRVDRIMAAGGHLLFGILAYWLAVRLLLDYTGDGPEFNLQILIDLLTIAAAIVVSWSTKVETVKRVYLLFGYVAFAGWMIQQFDSMENLLIILLALQAAVLHVIARLWTDETLVTAAHISFILIGGFLSNRLLLSSAEGTVAVNNQALSDLGVMAVAAGIGVWLKNNGARFVYLLAVHVALLLWFLRELSSLTDGQGYVTIAWGVYAIALLIVGLRKNVHKFRLVALGTLFLVVGKLFLVDLAKLETIWRVLLFFGFGGVFMFLSYYFQSLWKAAPEEKKEETEQ